MAPFAVKRHISGSSNCSRAWANISSLSVISSSPWGTSAQSNQYLAQSWDRAPGSRASWHPWVVDKTLAPVRDLTDSDQNQAVLDAASALIEGRTAAEDVAASHGPAVAAEAIAAARSRRRLGELTGPVHLTVVWAMYGETGRRSLGAAHPHGEDFVRARLRQLDWLTGGLTGVTWSIIACDDGCPDRPSSADLMTEIAAAEGYPAVGHRSVTVLRLAELIAGGIPISPAFDRLTSTDKFLQGRVDTGRDGRRGPDWPGQRQ